tara:strand:+ start:1699 stop:1830 length:132 start_codon:yes stop_codon:yes gene_type:complete
MTQENKKDHDEVKETMHKDAGAQVSGALIGYRKKDTEEKQGKE